MNSTPSKRQSDAVSPRKVDKNCKSSQKTQKRNSTANSPLITHYFKRFKEDYNHSLPCSNSVLKVKSEPQTPVKKKLFKDYEVITITDDETSEECTKVKNLNNVENFKTILGELLKEDSAACNSDTDSERTPSVISNPTDNDAEINNTKAKLKDFLILEKESIPQQEPLINDSEEAPSEVPETEKVSNLNLEFNTSTALNETDLNLLETTNVRKTLSFSLFDIISHTKQTDGSNINHVTEESIGNMNQDTIQENGFLTLQASSTIAEKVQETSTHDGYCHRPIPRGIDLHEKMKDLFDVSHVSSKNKFENCFNMSTNLYVVTVPHYVRKDKDVFPFFVGDIFKRCFETKEFISLERLHTCLQKLVQIIQMPNNIYKVKLDLLLSLIWYKISVSLRDITLETCVENLTYCFTFLSDVLSVEYDYSNKQHENADVIGKLAFLAFCLGVDKHLIGNTNVSMILRHFLKTIMNQNCFSNFLLNEKFDGMMLTLVKIDSNKIDLELASFLTLLYPFTKKGESLKARFCCEILNQIFSNTENCLSDTLKGKFNASRITKLFKSNCFSQLDLSSQYCVLKIFSNILDFNLASMNEVSVVKI